MTDFWHKKAVLSIAGAKIQKFEAESKLFPVECWKIVCKWLIYRNVSICVFASDYKSRLLNRFLMFEKAVIFGHGHFRSFLKNDSVILVYSIYKYIFILYYRGRFAPPKRKWPKMTVTENDRIRLLKVIRKEAMGDCNMMIITKLAYVVVSACTMFCIVGTAHILLLSTPVFLLFLRESWQNRLRNSSFYPFHPAFSPSYICLLRRWKVPSEPLFLALRAFFSSFLCKNQSSLSCHFCLGNVIFCWQWRLAI